MSGDGAAPSEESDETEFVMIKGRKRKIGEKICVHWKGIYGKEKMVETFGPDWRKSALQGVITGYGVRSKICVKRLNLPGQSVGEYAPQHGMWKIRSEDEAQIP